MDLNIKKSIKKLILYTMSVILFIVIVKHFSHKQTQEKLNSFISEAENSSGTSHYFIGSSRIKSSINPQLIRDFFNHEKVYNMGIYWSTFLSNSILAEFLIKKKGKKVVYIELSPLINSFSKDFIEFSKRAGFDPYLKANQLINHSSSLQQLRFKTDIFNQYLFSIISIKHEIKGLLNSNKTTKHKILGYESLLGNDFHSLSPFITYDEINNNKKYNKNLIQYKDIINYLVDLANNNNTKIVFILPITYNKQDEKDIVIPLYNSLPDNLKIKYSKKFISEISQPIFLKDKSHLNEKGATAYTQLLCPVIKDLFAKNTSHSKY